MATSNVNEYTVNGFVSGSINAILMVFYLVCGYITQCGHEHADDAPRTCCSRWRKMYFILFAVHISGSTSSILLLLYGYDDSIYPKQVIGGSFFVYMGLHTQFIMSYVSRGNWELYRDTCNVRVPYFKPIGHMISTIVLFGLYFYGKGAEGWYKGCLIAQCGFDVCVHVIFCGEVLCRSSRRNPDSCVKSKWVTWIIRLVIGLFWMGAIYLAGSKSIFGFVYITNLWSVCSFPFLYGGIIRTRNNRNRSKLESMMGPDIEKKKDIAAKEKGIDEDENTNNNDNDDGTVLQQTQSTQVRKILSNKRVIKKSQNEKPTPNIESAED